MPEQPNPRELLGGYATSTLSREERERLFAAALEDQQLFDELANDEPLRELLDNPLERQRLVNALSAERPAGKSWFSFASLRMATLYSEGLVGGGVAAAAVIAVILAFLLRGAGPANQPTTQAGRQEQARGNPSPAGPAAPAISQVQKEVVKPTDASVDQPVAGQVDGLRKLAQEQFARGERDQALATMTRALGMQPNDPQLKAILDEMLTDARARLREAHDNATAAGGPVRQSTGAPAVAAPPQSPDTEEAAIRALLQAYARAYSSRDSRGVQRVFPAVNELSLRRAFEQLRSLQVQIRDEHITITGTMATVSCTWDVVVTDQLGSSQQASQSVELRLQKANDSWIIVERR